MTSGHRLGRLGEEIACLFLQMCGYRLLETRFRVAGGEIDLIMMMGRQVVFVEVKTRGCGSPARPEDFVHRRQLARLRRVASRWLAAYPGSYAGCRLDVVAVEFSGPDRGLRLRHFRDVG